MKRPLKNAVAIMALALTLLMAFAAPAAAHVVLDSSESQGDGEVLLTFSFNHACAEAPTTELTMSMPEGSQALDTTPPDGWEGDVTSDQISWSGLGIDTGLDVTFTVTARLTGQIGKPLIFPTEQRCADGDGYSWTDVDESGNEPAPRLIATAAVLDPALSSTAAATKADGAGPWAILIALISFAALGGGLARLNRSRG